MENNKQISNKVMYITFMIFMPILIGASFPIFNIKLNNREIFLIILGIIINVFVITNNLDKNTIISTVMTTSMLTLRPFYIIIFIGCFICLIRNKNYFYMYLFTIIVTCLGMLFRYIIEYGEISNVRNFTIINITSTLIFIPLLSIIVSKIIDKFSQSEKN